MGLGKTSNRDPSDKTREIVVAITALMPSVRWLDGCKREHWDTRTVIWAHFRLAGQFPRSKCQNSDNRLLTLIWHQTQRRKLIPRGFCAWQGPEVNTNRARCAFTINIPGRRAVFIHWFIRTAL